MITSIVPGRVRLRGASLRDASRLDDLREAIQAMPEVTSLTANHQVGSLLVQFDDAAIGVEAMQARLQGLLNTNEPSVEGMPFSADDQAVVPEQGCPLGQGAQPLAKRQNGNGNGNGGFSFGQGMKLGMLGSLGASMAWAVKGKKGPHKETGALFLLFMAGHMWVHRKRLLK